MSIKSLPSMEHTFTISVKGSDSPQMFEGSFTYRRPNLKAKSDIAKTEARLNENVGGLDEETRFLHRMLATLRHTLVKMPEWWSKADYGFDLYDTNVVLEVYKNCSDFETKWFNEVWTEQEAKKEDKTLAGS